MGRKKKELFKVVIPNSLLGLVGLNDSSEVSNYKLAHFISILTHHIYSNYPDGGYYLKKPLTSVYLGTLYNKRYLSEVIVPLKQVGIIQVNDSYSTDLGFCKEYGFNKDIIQEVIDEGYTEVYITKNTLINRINEWQRETLSRQIKKYPFIETEADMLLNLSVDTTALEQLYSQRIEDIRQSNEKKKKLAITNARRHKEEVLQLTEARDLLDARVRYISGRVYHPFVNCPREYRKAVVDEQGQPYEEVDLRSSQAVFLCKVIAVALKHRLFTLRLHQPAIAVDRIIEQIIPHLNEPINLLEEDVYPSDFTAFIRAVFLDDIYEDASPKNLSQTASKQLNTETLEIGGYRRVSGAKNLIGEERERAKKKFFKEIFFNYFNKENSGSEQQLSVSSEYLKDFYQNYPSVAEFCRICAAQSGEKKKKSRDLALLLQQTESKFFHELLSAALSKLEPFNYFVVHDAVYVPQKHQEAVIEACNGVAVKSFGVSPQFR